MQRFSEKEEMHEQDESTFSLTTVSLKIVYRQPYPLNRVSSVAEIDLLLHDADRVGHEERQSRARQVNPAPLDKKKVRINFTP